ncbi:MAG: putative addiction module antidote protein [Nitrospinae bacterium]|nr:putative addiction module antidote protein [Nitrospinota bacterium]
MKRTKNELTSFPWEETLHEELQDDEEARLYLQACMDDDPRVFLIALKDVVTARGLTMADMARRTGLNRENLYRVFSSKGNPNWKTITAILDVLGFSFSIDAKAKAS